MTILGIVSIACAVTSLTACAVSDDSRTRGASSIGSSGTTAELLHSDREGPIASSLSAGVGGAPEQVEVIPLSAPRTAVAVRFSRLWEFASSDVDTVLMAPFDVHLSALGILVFDQGASAIRVFDATTGRFVRSVGSRGKGPGEFTVAGWFQGAYERPVVFDGIQRRLTPIAQPFDTLRSQSIAAGESWGSTCALDANRTLGTAFRSKQPEFLIAAGGRVVDSMYNPWPALHAMHYVARQSVIRQLDDTTCAIATLFQGDFAILTGDGDLMKGTYIEPASPVEQRVRKYNDGVERRSIRLAPGARIGARDIRGWRDRTVILYGGRSKHAGRLLDFYSRTSMAYEGSLVLPFVAQRISVHGDTLVAIGSRDDYPVIAAFLLGSAGNLRTP